ncbi:hypothetical protein [Streptomyces hyaluromycini]|uniref:hypothetical protein n=1 Tax=Streptomyces hyaluromycini TaxID=1377993 RepID=UPI000B5CFCD1|nr:hypothetical protein [Streptomyces hyaluromycini]
MSDLSYTPTFAPTDWIDNVHRIQADGTNGFNVRFDAIQADLQQAAAVVSEINTAIGRPVGVPTGQQLLTPGLDLVSTPNSVIGGWTYDETGAAHPDAGSAGGSAVMGLSLPADIRLVSFRAIGLFAGGATSLNILLLRIPLSDASAAPDRLAEIRNSTSVFTNPYDITVPVDTAFAAVDPDTFRYYIALSTGFVQDSSATSLATVQLAYTAS